jgi:hydrogenase nickel incorporation protein HypB
MSANASAAPRTIAVGASLLGRNDERAAENRRRFADHGVAVLNVLSSPGSGKTALLARTLADLAPQIRGAVVVGDLATDLDARRFAAAGVPVVQVTTGALCHLEAGMVAAAVRELDLGTLDLLAIENVGNLVCPAAFDLGEDARIVLMSVTEGEDKPDKYAVTFKSADAVVITKTDLAAAAGFDRDAVIARLAALAPRARVLEVSARTGEGLAPWYDYVRARARRPARSAGAAGAPLTGRAPEPAAGTARGER